MDAPKRVWDAGEQAVSSFRRSIEGRIVELIRRDPERAAGAIEVGLIDRAWLDAPDERPFRSVPPVEIIKRFIEKSVEQRPSVLSSLGLDALQALSWQSARMVGGNDEPTTLAVVFTDLEGFTRYTSDFGDAAAVALLEVQHKAVSPVVRGRGGRVVKRIGDGLMLSFPQPEAAVKAALEMVSVAPAPLRLRAGVHCGEVLVTKDDLFGHAVNVAARITEHAKGGQVLASGHVREAVGDLPGVAFGRRRSTVLKGVPDPIPICRVMVAPPS